MNRSPEDIPDRPREAALDDRITAPGLAPSEPELAADAALRHELRALAPVEPLPPGLKAAVLARTTGAGAPRSGWRGLPLALAAGLAGLLVLAVLRPSGPEPLPGDELELALATIDRTSRDALGRAGREVGESLHFPAIEFPMIELEQLPYGHLLRSLSVSTPPNHSPEDN